MKRIAVITGADGEAPAPQAGDECLNEPAGTEIKNR